MYIFSLTKTSVSERVGVFFVRLAIAGWVKERTMMSRSRREYESSSHLPRIAILFAVLASFLAVAAAQTTVPVVTGEARVDKLLSQMTLEEKMALIRGASEDPATNQ